MSYSLSRGSSGPQVTALQQALIAKGVMGANDPNGNSNIDGRFGAITHDAVIEFQKTSDLAADGIVGKDTAAALGLAPIAASIEKRPENILQVHQLDRLAEIIDSLIPTGFVDLIDDEVIKSLVYKLDRALVKLLPESWVRYLNDLSKGVRTGDMSAFRSRAVKSLNAERTSV
ncbi:MAG: peptidoglycan-binding protein, partial [Methyloversatilis sp.]|nr:peptidoglycan-binding protein [Methyloversatilis sp.]